uniref:Integrase catalytic domain-containing protein n=1 Tax=Vitis vinifera TaxID=29760 RepID=A5AIL6_VITVI|nr:hypothetical protein VITISV_032875 [Vitis vinifera]
MVHQGIVLGHIISKQGIEVDKAKVELIVKLPSPTTIKGVRRFIKDLSKLERPLCELLLFLTTALILRAPNWKLPFEVMCDASDFAIGAILGEREDGKPYVIYYASKTLNEVQRNYTITENELLVVFFALDKFRAYLVGSFIVDKKVRPIRWILLLQEFNLQIKDKKGVENVVADHLSRLAIAHNSHSLPINDDFPEESLMLMEVAPWYAHIANYLVTREVPSEWKTQDKKHFFAKIHAYYWEEPFLFKYCADQIIRKSCDRCQRLGKLKRKNMMPLNPILIVDIFYVWGIDFMGPFPMPFGYSYILVGSFLKFLKENIFSRFGVPKAIISDGGTHFCNKPFETLLAKYGVKRKVATPYHPQTSGQVELANQEIKKHIDERVGMKRFLDLNEMEELRNDAYNNSNIAKQRLKTWHDQLVSRKEFQKGQRVFLYDSKLHIFPKKLKSRWISPCTIQQVHSNGVVELLNSNNTESFKVDFKTDGKNLKKFLAEEKPEKQSISHTLRKFRMACENFTGLAKIPNIISQGMQKFRTPSFVKMLYEKCAKLKRRRYETRRLLTTPGATSSRLESSVHRTPTKRAKTSGPGELSRPSQPDPRAPVDSQRLSSMSPEAFIKRPMVTAPPIEGNLDCRAIPFHSELYFDLEDQHTPILRQIQQHLGLLPPPQPDIPRPSEPITPVKETILVEKTTRVDVLIQPTQEATIEASSSHDPTTTLSSLYLEVPLPPFIFNRSRHIKDNVDLGWRES